MRLEYSAWFNQNDLDPLGTTCIGIGGAKKGPVDVEHATFPCSVARGGTPAGVVIATARPGMAEGDAHSQRQPDRGVGAVPQGPLAMISSDAPRMLSRPRRGPTHTKSARRSASGSARTRRRFSASNSAAFNCPTYDPGGKRAGTVVVQVLSSASLSVVRTLS